MKRLLHVIGLISLSPAIAAPVWAGEYVVLESQLGMPDQHGQGAVRSDLLRRQVVEMPLTSITGYEQEEILPIAPPADVLPAMPPASIPHIAGEPHAPAELAAQLSLAEKLWHADRAACPAGPADQTALDLIMNKLAS